MKRILKVALISIGLYALSVPPAYAGPVGSDAALSVSVSPSSSVIHSGDDVSLTYTITNVGTNSIAPTTLHYIFLSPEFTYQSISSSLASLHCPQVTNVGTALNFDPKYDDYSVVVCYGVDVDETFSAIAPGGTHTFTIHTVANLDFNAGTTKAFGVHFPNSDIEYDGGSLATEFQDMSENGGDFALLDTNNISSYTYSDPVSSTTQPAQTGEGSNSSSEQGAGGSEATLNTTQGLATGEALPTQSENQQSVTDKAKVAIGKKLNLPDKITQPDKNRPRVGLSEKYKDEILSITLVLLVVAIISYLIRRRYLRSISKQRDYRNALKIMEKS